MLIRNIKIHEVIDNKICGGTERRSGPIGPLLYDVRVEMNCTAEEVRKLRSFLKDQEDGYSADPDERAMLPDKANALPPGPIDAEFIDD